MENPEQQRIPYEQLPFPAGLLILEATYIAKICALRKQLLQLGVVLGNIDGEILFMHADEYDPDVVSVDAGELCIAQSNRYVNEKRCADALIEQIDSYRQQLCEIVGSIHSYTTTA